MEYYIGIALMFIIVIFFKTPVGKGMIGEWVVRMIMGKNRPRKDTFTIHNLMFYDGTKSVQIDHVLVNSTGLHVVETKNYGGMIYGNETDKEWTQVLSYGKVKNRFYSPIKQNQGHIYSLKQVLPMKVPMYSYVVFTGRATLRVKSNQTPVIYPLSLKRNIKHQRKQGFNMKPLEVRQLYELLKNLKSSNTISNREHIAEINQRKSYRKDQVHHSER